MLFQDLLFHCIALRIINKHGGIRNYQTNSTYTEMEHKRLTSHCLPSSNTLYIGELCGKNFTLSFYMITITFELNLPNWPSKSIQRCLNLRYNQTQIFNPLFLNQTLSFRVRNNHFQKTVRRSFIKSQNNMRIDE